MQKNMVKIRLIDHKIVIPDISVTHLVVTRPDPHICLASIVRLIALHRIVVEADHNIVSIDLSPFSLADAASPVSDHSDTFVLYICFILFFNMIIL